MAKGEVRIQTHLYDIPPHVSKRAGFLILTLFFRLAGYPQIGRAACGKAGTIIVQVFHKATLVGYALPFAFLEPETCTSSYFHEVCVFESIV